MKTEDAVKMIEICLQTITETEDLVYLTDLIIEKRIKLATPQKRNYTKKDKGNVE